MNLSKSKVVCAYTMSAVLTNAPQMAFAEAASNLKMVPTTQIVMELSQAEAEARVNDFLKRDDVRQELMARGVSADEAGLRLASLSKTELNNLATQMEQARAGGDILLTILVVILIIFLIQRL